MDIRNITVNKIKFKIVRYKHDIFDGYIYAVSKYDPSLSHLFDQYKCVFKCNLSTLKENLIRYTLEQTLL